MKLAYQYRLLPTSQQSAAMTRWLELLRLQYNWMLAERFDWYERNHCSVSACPLICHLPEFKEQPDYFIWYRSLPDGFSERWHSCPHCGNEMDRDTNAAIVIKKVGLGIASLKNAQPGKARKRSLHCTA